MASTTSISAPKDLSCTGGTARVFFSVFVALVTYLMVAPPAIATSSDLGVPPLITVSTTAEKSIDPTMAVIQLESFGKAKQAKIAQDLQAKEYSRVKNIIEKFKIKKEDFVTQNYNIQPEYTYDQKTQNNKLTGYRASHQIRVTLKKIDSVGEFLDALTSQSSVESAGVTVQGIEWDSDKKASAETAAMVDAVKIARQKAEDLANAAGVKIKSTYSISHSSSQIGIIRPQMEMARAKMMSYAADSGGETEVNGQSIKVRAEVTLQFLIKE